MYKKSILAAVAATLLSSGASAAELQFTVHWGSNDPGVVETFDVNTSLAGTPSAASVSFYGFSSDEDFAITKDSLGNSVLLVGDGNDGHNFSTSFDDYHAFNNLITETSPTSAHFYNDVSPYLQAYAGETASSPDGTFISVSGVPEPAAWALMLVGVGAVGAALRSRRSLVGMAI